MQRITKFDAENLRAPRLKRSAPARVAIDLVESGGGMWKVSSIPAIQYCVNSGAKIRSMAGVSGGSILVGLIAAGATLSDLLAALPKIHDVGFMDAFQIPARLHEVFPQLLLVKNRAGRLPKLRSRTLGETDIELSIACARLNVAGSFIDTLKRVGRSLQGTTFRKLLLATTELTSFLRGVHVQETMQRVVEGTVSEVLSSSTTPDVAIVDAMAASCAFFVSHRVHNMDLHDGFYFSNLPTRALTRGRRRCNILAHQTDPFVGDTWTNWLLRRVFSPEAIEMLRARWNVDEELAARYGVLIHPRVQEISSPFSAALTTAMVNAGRDALTENRFEIDRNLLKK